METYTVVVGDVQHVGMLMDETVVIGNVILGPVPGELRYYLGESGTAAVVQVVASAEDEAKKLAEASLENAITVLTYAFCRQSMVEQDGSPLGQLDMIGAVVAHYDENEQLRSWRRGLQRITRGGSNEVAGRVVVTRTTLLNLLPRRTDGTLVPYVSDLPTQTLWQILNRDETFRTDSLHTEYADSTAAAAVHLRHSMEADQPHKLIDAFTGLEALFTPRRADVFYPVGATIGYGVAYTCAGRRDPTARLTTWKLVKDLYGERSRLVHGDRLSNGTPHAASNVEKMLVEAIEFCLIHKDMMLSCGGITSWLDMVRFGCPESLEREDDLPS